MNKYQKGARAEYRAMKILEKAGYYTVRSAGSQGLFDVIAWNGAGVRLIQIKAGDKRASGNEREAMAMCPAPLFATKEVWSFPDYCRKPLIEVL